MTSRCALCPGVNLCIPPDGPGDADILFIGEAPGKDENRKGRVFIGKTGEEVNRHYLPLAGLRRDSVVFANAIRCLPDTSGGKLDPTRAADLALLDSCATRHLYPLIERLRPKLIVPLGAFACRSIGLEISLELEHGLLRETVWGIPAFPMFHPALGIHEPKKMLYIRTDWIRLKQHLRGTALLPQDPYPEPDYREVEYESEIHELDPTLTLAADTESKRFGDPFCLTFSQEPGTGRLIRAGRRDLLEAFQQQITHWEAPILFHYWLHDWPVTEAMGLQFPYRRIVDTASKVFHLGNLPQGLKALALRELGMQMQDFDDLVTPYSTSLILLYYQILQSENWPKPEPRAEQDSKTGLWKMKNPQGMNTKLKRFFTDYGKNPDKDVFGMWEKNWEAEQEMLEEKFGPWPGKCISHVPFEKTLFYACRDADALIRLWPLLQWMKARVRHTTQEHWRAA